MCELRTGQSIHDLREREEIWPESKIEKNSNLFTFFLFRQRFGIMQATGPRCLQAIRIQRKRFFYYGLKL